MHIRNMKADDYQNVDRLMSQVHRLHVEGRPDLYCEAEHIYTEEQFHEMINEEDSITVLAEEEDIVLGICMVSFRKRTCMIDRRTAYMDDLCVDESARGKGIGRKLFEYAKQKAKEMGAERLDLMVWGFNENAKRFYESMGMDVQRYIMEEKL